jgi:DNA-binding transcriptional regulator YiaG
MGNTSARAITFLCKTVPNAKDLQKLGTLEIRIIRRKRKISVPCFQRKFEVGKKK